MNARNGKTLDEDIDEHLRAIGAIGNENNARGWTRLAFSEEEDTVHQYAADALTELGFRVSTDAFKNLIGVLRGTEEADAPLVMLGTHLDTVKNGGNYDGVVGFIVAVEAVREVLLSGKGRPPLAIVIFRAEESTRFKKACLGSRAAFLGLDEDTLGLCYENRNGMTVTLAQAVATAGGTPSALSRPTIEGVRCRAYFETHIEQARVLEQRIGLDRAEDQDRPQAILGIVTSIRAPHRCEWEVSGQRSVLLFARCVIAVEDAAILANRLGLDAVATVGRVDDFFVGPDKINAIPGRVEFPINDQDTDVLSQAERIASARRCRLEVVREDGSTKLRIIGTTDHSGGTPMGLENRQDALVAACAIVANLPAGAIPPCDRIVFATDVRSNSVGSRDFVSDLMAKSFECIEGLEVVHFTRHAYTRIEKIRRFELSEPLQSLTPALQEMIASAAREEGIDVERLPSGAGHDAMMAAIAGVPTAMMFIPSKEGLSHNPAEWSRTKDIAAAVKVQARILQRLA